MFTIRHIQRSDNPSVSQLIHKVMPEFGCDGPGFAMRDPEVEDMYASYQQARSIYLVLMKKKTVVGGAGIAPLLGGESNICELKKMYFLPEARSQGFGQKLLARCLAEAKNFHFTGCYLETASSMLQAQRLYTKMGFEKLTQRLGDTGHHACDCYYVKHF